MATFVIRLEQDGLQEAATVKNVTKLLKGRWPKAVIGITKEVKPGTSRSDRFDEAQGDVNDAKSIAEELRDELQSWHDNLPENLQDGQKASELDDAIGQLDEFIEALETAEGVSVDFPGMF